MNPRSTEEDWLVALRHRRTVEDWVELNDTPPRKRRRLRLGLAEDGGIVVVPDVEAAAVPRRCYFAPEARYETLRLKSGASAPPPLRPPPTVVDVVEVVDLELPPGAPPPRDDAACREALYERLREQCGEPLQDSAPKGSDFNENYFAASFVSATAILFEPDEQNFYDYVASTGLWSQLTDDAARQKLAAHFASRLRDGYGAPPSSSRYLNATINLAKGRAAQERVFLNRTIENRKIHTLDGMVRIEDLQLEDFSAANYSRNQIPIRYCPSASCPEFISFLEASLEDDDDIDLFQRWGGLGLIGTNLASAICILSGTAGGGKSTLMGIIEKLIGPLNVADFRVDQQSRAFETSRYIGKTLLCGADVPGDFLMRRGSEKLKAYTGGDRIHAELKNKSRPVSFFGTLNVLLTCNSTLRVRLDGDADAWRRRLIIFDFVKPPPARMVPQYDDRLLVREGSGILNFFLTGARRILAELSDSGRFSMTEKQRRRVDDLLRQSEPVREFIETMVEPSSAENAAILVEEMDVAFASFCHQRGWKASELPGKLPGQFVRWIFDLHGIPKVHSVRHPTTGKDRNGWKGLVLRRL